MGAKYNTKKKNRKKYYFKKYIKMVDLNLCKI